MEFNQIKIFYDPEALPRRGALASCARGRLGLITGCKFRKGERIWCGVPIGMSDDENEPYMTWQSRSPKVIGYLNPEDLI